MKTEGGRQSENIEDVRIRTGIMAKVFKVMDTIHAAVNEIRGVEHKPSVKLDYNTTFPKNYSEDELSRPAYGLPPNTTHRLLHESYAPQLREISATLKELNPTDQSTQPAPPAQYIAQEAPSRAGGRE